MANREALGTGRLRTSDVYAIEPRLVQVDCIGMTDLRGTRFRAVDVDKRGSSSEEVVLHLREMIHRGERQRGDRLPPERDLAKLLGVSRPTLRAGIRSLTAVGILQSRQGAGTFVAQAEESPTLDGGPLRMMAALHGFTT